MTFLALLPNPGEFYHFGSTLARELVWMSVEEFRIHSIARRASYSYLNAIVEGTFKAVGQAIAKRGHSPAASYRARFAEAGKLAILPETLAHRMQKLAKLRNRITHETSEVNQNLEVFPVLLEMIVISLAMSSIVAALRSSKSTYITITPEVILERATSADNALGSSALVVLNSKIVEFQNWIELKYEPPTHAPVGEA
jgi:uncharacterized protein YutE (UPF0331/DUF86 family)